MRNKNLHTAKKAKKDEFFTRYEDIENEIKNYPLEIWKDKIVYCNCDDFLSSNFYKYFKDNFKQLGLKELWTTGYYVSHITGETRIGDGIKSRTFMKRGNIHTESHGYNVEGDFRHPINIELLKQADIVVTNPPFSLFRDYFKLLVEYDKKFLILGNQNAITFKEIFPLFKNGKMWLGYGVNKMLDFFMPLSYEGEEENNKKCGKVCGITWFTNLPVENKNKITLTKRYNENDYPRYDNYDAINVDRVKDIPKDYDGIIGVPITILKYLNNDGYIHLDYEV